MNTFGKIVRLMAGIAAFLGAQLTALRRLNRLS